MLELRPAQPLGSGVSIQVPSTPASSTRPAATSATTTLAQPNLECPKNVHTLLEDSYSDEDKPGQIHMNNVHINTVARDEAIINISVQLPDRPLVPASMEVKVDTGAQGNVLPMRAFRVMCPDRMDSKQKIKVSALIPCNTTILTAYNCTHIPIHGMYVNCRENNKTPWSPPLVLRSRNSWTNHTRST